MSLEGGTGAGVGSGGVGVPVYLHTGAKSWRPAPTAISFQIIVLVSFCSEQNLGIFELLSVQVLGEVTPKDAIAWLHSSCDVISNSAGQEGWR